MKRLIAIIGILLITQPAIAKNVKVQATSDFSTANPPKTWTLRVIEDFTAKNDFCVKAGSTITGEIVEVKSPKRLKRNASFVFSPIKFYDVNTNETYEISKHIEGKYSSMSDVSAGSIAKSGAIMAGNKLLDGFFGPGIALAEGAIKNKQGNRVKSAAVSVYESTPLSYANKGKDIEISKDQIFVMSFKMLEEDKPNYEYEEQ